MNALLFQLIYEGRTPYITKSDTLENLNVHTRVIQGLLHIRPSSIINWQPVKHYTDQVGPVMLIESSIS